jgi:hypothetical protein
MVTLWEENRWVRMLVGTLFLAISLALLVFVTVNLVSDGSLWLLGKKTTAVVVDSWAEQANQQGEGELVFEYFVRYQFTTLDGRTITATSQVGPAEWVGVGYGQQSGVRHDVMDERSVGPAAPVYQEQKHVTQYVTAGMEKGSVVPVVYFPPYPSHNRLDESRFVSVLACAYVPFAFLGGFGAVASLRVMRGARAGTTEPLWP